MRNEAVIAQLTRGSIAKTLFTLTTLILAKLRLPGPYRPGTGKPKRREEHNFLWGTSIGNGSAEVIASFIT
jgi:hypothetical protein